MTRGSCGMEGCMKACTRLIGPNRCCRSCQPYKETHSLCKCLKAVMQTSIMVNTHLHEPKGCCRSCQPYQDTCRLCQCLATAKQNLTTKNPPLIRLACVLNPTKTLEIFVNVQRQSFEPLTMVKSQCDDADHCCRSSQPCVSNRQNCRV